MRRCEACEGIGWRRRQVPHPACPGYFITNTRVCSFCQGKGNVKDFQPCGKDKAAQSQDAYEEK